MSSFAQQLRSRLFGGVLEGSSQASAAAGVDLSRKTRRNTSTAHLDTVKSPYSFGTVQYPDDLGTAEFGHYIMFYIYEVAKSKYAGPQTETSEIFVQRLYRNHIRQKKVLHHLLKQRNHLKVQN